MNNKLQDLMTRLINYYEEDAKFIFEQMANDEHWPEEMHPLMKKHAEYCYFMVELLKLSLEELREGSPPSPSLCYWFGYHSALRKKGIDLLKKESEESRVVLRAKYTLILADPRITKLLEDADPKGEN